MISVIYRIHESAFLYLWLIYTVHKDYPICTYDICRPSWIGKLPGACQLN